jgi:NTP pyrophosphatase (non-canonical NTP hydrolase)
MDFKTLQQKVVDNAISYGKKYGVEIDEDFALLKLYEELGELSQAVLIHKKKSRPEKHKPHHISKDELAQELADVMGMVIVYANLVDVDLQEAIRKKWIDRDDR